MKILINDKCEQESQYVDGKLMFIKANYDDLVEGMLYCNEYIEDIKSIQTDRFLITDIDVIAESGGTNHYAISYRFESHSPIEYLDDPLTFQQRLDIEKQILGIDRIDDKYVDLTDAETLEFSNIDIWGD